MTSIRVLVSAVVIVVVIVGVGLALLSLGSYDVAADARGSPAVDRFIVFVRNRSIDERAAGVAVPSLKDPKLLAQGAAHYAEMCTICHLAPGMKDSEVRIGLNPKPPNLTHDGRRLDPATTFWVIKHGVAMTAMPSWGRTHDDRSLWALTAFVEKLPTLSALDYSKMLGQGAGPPRKTSDANNPP